MNRKKLVRLFVGLVAVCVCTTTVQAETRGVTDSEIIVGTYQPLTGPLGANGIASLRGMRLRFDEANAKGGIHGRKIKLIAEDSQYSVPLSVQKANKLIYQDNVFAMIGAFGTSHNKAVFKVQLKEKVPNLFPASYSRSMVEPTSKLKFMNTPTDYEAVRIGVKYFMEQKGKKRFCFMGIETGYGRDMETAAKDQLQLSNMKLEKTAFYKYGERNFTATILKFKKSNCDVVLLGSFVPSTILIISNARKLGWDVQFFGSVGLYHHLVPQLGGELMEGLMAVNYYDWLNEESDAGQKFIANVKNAYGIEPHNNITMAYTNAHVFLAGLEKAGRNLTVDSFAKGMESIRNLKSPFIAPDRNYSSTNHNGHKKAWIVEIKNGKWRPANGKVTYLSL